MGDYYENDPLPFIPPTMGGKRSFLSLGGRGRGEGDFHAFVPSPRAAWGFMKKRVDFSHQF